MRAETAFPGAVVVDSYPFSEAGTLAQAQALKSTGVDALAGYIGVINTTRVGYLHQAGLRFIPVTLARDALEPQRIVQGLRFSLGQDGLAKLKAAGAAAPHAYVDLEGPTNYDLGKANPADLIAKLNASFAAIHNLGLRSGLYLAPPQALTSEEAFQRLSCTTYWKGMGSVRDRANELVEPRCGWGMTQMYHGIAGAGGMVWKDLDPSRNQTVWKNTGVFVDPNMVGADFQRRLLAWVAPDQ